MVIYSLFLYLIYILILRLIIMLQTRELNTTQKPCTYCVRCTAYCVLRTAYGVNLCTCTAYCVLRTAYGVNLCTVYRVLCTVYSVVAITTDSLIHWCHKSLFYA